MCDFCGKGFSQKTNLNMHLHIHSVPKNHKCEICEKAFIRKGDLDHHVNIHTHERKFTCDTCSSVFNHYDSLQCHLKLHAQKQFECDKCHQFFQRPHKLQNHIQKMHSHFSSIKRLSDGPSSAPKKFKSTSRHSALNNTFSVQNFVPEDQNCKDLVICLNAMKPLLQHGIEQELLEKNSVKWYLTVSLQLSKTLPDGIEDVITADFSSRNSIEFLAYSIPSHLDEAFDKIKSSFEEFLQKGSGWVLKKINLIELKSSRYTPLRPSSYIPLPPKTIKKNAVINIKNSDQKCFIWCLLAHKLNIPNS